MKRNIDRFPQRFMFQLNEDEYNHMWSQISIIIMDAFVEMRKFLSNNGQIFERLTNVEYKLLEHDKKFEEVFNQFQHNENVKQNYSLIDKYMMLLV